MIELYKPYHNPAKIARIARKRLDTAKRKRIAEFRKKHKFDNADKYIPLLLTKYFLMMLCERKRKLYPTIYKNIIPPPIKKMTF